MKFLILFAKTLKLCQGNVFFPLFLLRLHERMKDLMGRTVGKIIYFLWGGWLILCANSSMQIGQFFVRGDASLDSGLQ